MNAEAALQSARDAKAEAEALPSGNVNRDSLIAALEAAVQGTDADKPDGPGQPRRGGSALGPAGGNDGRGARVEFDYIAAAIPEGAVEMDVHQGMT